MTRAGSPVHPDPDRAAGAASVRRAGMEDAEALGVVGPAAYAAAHGYLWDHADALARQLATFGEAAFRDLIARPGARVWVAQAGGGGATVGFLSMLVGSVDPVSGRPGGAEIPRVYLLPGAQRSGLGRALPEAAVARARAEALTHVWLDVMASAGWARSAYAKWGFRELGPATFDRPVKPGLAGMVVLAKDLA